MPGNHLETHLSVRAVLGTGHVYLDKSITDRVVLGTDRVVFKGLGLLGMGHVYLDTHLSQTEQCLERTMFTWTHIYNRQSSAWDGPCLP